MVRVVSLSMACVMFTNVSAVDARSGSDRSAARRAGHAGVAALIGGRFKTAVNALNRAAKLEPKNRIWWMNLGWALNALKRSGEAINAFNRATGLTKPTEYYVMGQILWGLAEAHENKKDCAGMALHLRKWIALTNAQSSKIRNRKIVKAQVEVARQRIRICPKRAKADRRR